MARITNLWREGRRSDRVAVELDGSPWRTLPLEVVVRTRLQAGSELDRERARTLRRELRRHEALAASAVALRHRDLSTRRLEQRLERRAVPPAERARAVETLTRAGLLDDARFARGRAVALAARGYGDAAIRFDLERQGVAAEVATEALAELEPERDRAVRFAAGAGGAARAARLLARRGFGEDAIEAAACVAETG
jgi:SOS response regulatory protein OraA/RecX